MYRLLRAVVMFALAALAACGKESDKKPATQVAAKVNGEEITVHQVNAVLARAPQGAQEMAAQAKHEALERLVEQQLAMQQALHRKLDRTPTVQFAIDAARREILARAYVDHVIATQPKPTEEEGRKYFTAHPELFSQRRVYVLEEIVATMDDAAAAALRERVAKARSLKDVADWLAAQRIPFAPNRVVRAAEQIPLEILPKVYVARAGDVFIIENRNVRQVVRLVESRLEPVDEATAMPRIMQFLSNRRAKEAADAEIKQLKASAEIEYTGEFKSVAATEAAARERASAKARSEAAVKERMEAEERAKTTEATRTRLAAEARARLEAEERERSAAQRQPALPQEAIKKGLGALK